MVDATHTDADNKAHLHSHDLFRKTQMCKFNQAGSCTRGSACAFAHSTLELQRLPDLYKSHLCARFSLSGSCKKGVACQYAHGAQELRSVQNKHGQAIRLAKAKHQAMDTSSNQKSVLGHQAVVPCIAVPVVAQTALIVGVNAFCAQDLMVGQGVSDDFVGNMPKLDMVSWNLEALDFKTSNFACLPVENFNGCDDFHLKQGANQRYSAIQWN